MQIRSGHIFTQPAKITVALSCTKIVSVSPHFNRNLIGLTLGLKLA